MIAGKYVAVSGNTGAGKSTLVRAVGAHAADRGYTVAQVQERDLHASAVPLMFTRPELFALPVQFAFAVNRHLALLGHMTEGRDLVAERSHLDDRLFVVQHVRDGNVSESEAEGYFRAADVLNARLPQPDLMVLLDVDPSEALRRIRADEDAGTRPREFPSEPQKEHLVHAWHALYKDFHARLRAAWDPASILVCSSDTSPGEIAAAVCERVGWR